MKIYTYYENIQYDNQQEMLRLWQTSWKNSGFDPIVLSLEDAKKHSFYKEFVDQLKDLHFRIMNKPINDYGLSCYVRWLAYSTQQDEYFYVSDYDCINNGLEPVINTDKLHLMDGACPCFASGEPNQFKNLCHLFVDVSLQRIEDIILKTKEHKWYHDQEFCDLNLMNSNNVKATEILKANNIIMTSHRKNGVGPFEVGKKNTLKVLHISHQNAKNIKTTIKEFEKMSINDLRVLLMEKITNEKDFILW